MIAVLDYQNFAIHLAQLEGLTPVVARHKNRVVAACDLATNFGVQTGLTLEAAKLRAPNVQVVENDSPKVRAAWLKELQQMNSITDRIEAQALGVMALELNRDEAKELAKQKQVGVGFAPSLELARLASLLATPGEVYCVSQLAELATMPIDALTELGLSKESVMRLHWLGVNNLGDLLVWNKKQVFAFLPEHKNLEHYFFGTGRTRINRYKPALRIMAREEFDEPILEPHQLHLVLGVLTERIIAQLGTRAASLVTVRARSAGLNFVATRLTKQPLAQQHKREILETAKYTLADSGVFGLEVESLSLELTGLEFAGRDAPLFDKTFQLVEARKNIEQRFPGVTLRIKIVNPFALLSSRKFSLETFQVAEVNHAPSQQAHKRVAQQQG